MIYNKISLMHKKYATRNHADFQSPLGTSAHIVWIKLLAIPLTVSYVIDL